MRIYSISKDGHDIFTPNSTLLPVCPLLGHTWHFRILPHSLEHGQPSGPRIASAPSRHLPPNRGRFSPSFLLLRITTRFPSPSTPPLMSGQEPHQGTTLAHLIPCVTALQISTAITSQCTPPPSVRCCPAPTRRVTGQVVVIAIAGASVGGTRGVDHTTLSTVQYHRHSRQGMRPSMLSCADALALRLGTPPCSTAQSGVLSTSAHGIYVRAVHHLYRGCARCS